MIYATDRLVTRYSQCRLLRHCRTGRLRARRTKNSTPISMRKKGTAIPMGFTPYPTVTQLDVVTKAFDLKARVSSSWIKLLRRVFAVAKSRVEGYIYIYIYIYLFASSRQLQLLAAWFGYGM